MTTLHLWLRRAARPALVLLFAVSLAPAAQAQGGPRLGEYKIVTVSGTSGVVTGLMALKDGGVYEIYDMPAKTVRSRGTYRYDAGQKRVVWLSGPNQEVGRGGSFSEREGGKVHRILWGPKAYATNGD